MHAQLPKPKQDPVPGPGHYSKPNSLAKHMVVKSDTFHREVRGNALVVKEQMFTPPPGGYAMKSAFAKASIVKDKVHVPH